MFFNIVECKLLDKIITGQTTLYRVIFKYVIKKVTYHLHLSVNCHSSRLQDMMESWRAQTMRPHKFYISSFRQLISFDKLTYKQI